MTTGQTWDDPQFAGPQQPGTSLVAKIIERKVLTDCRKDNI
jgi:hypothetical protein